jgi:hypothetical protein
MKDFKICKDCGIQGDFYWMCKPCWSEYRKKRYEVKKQLKRNPTTPLDIKNVDKFFKVGYKERIRKYIQEEIIPKMDKYKKKIK